MPGGSSVDGGGDRSSGPAGPFLDRDRRLDKVEEDLASQGKQVAAIATEVAGISRSQSDISHSLQRLLARDSGSEAVKGMVPLSTVTWGIGMLVSLVGVGLTALTLAGAMVLWAVKVGDDRNQERSDLKVTALAGEVEENQFWVDDTRNELEGVLRSRFTTEEGLALRDRLTVVETELARRSTLLDRIQHDLDDHVGTRDHPYRQTYELEALKRQVEALPVMGRASRHDHGSEGKEDDHGGGEGGGRGGE